MNIIYFTQDDPFYVKILFDEFFKSSKALHEIKAIVISHPMGKKSILKLARQMYDLYGPTDFMRMGLKYVFIWLKSKKRLEMCSIDNVPKTYSLKQLASVYGIDVIERNDLNSKSCQDLLKQYDPDLFISVACPIIFKEDLIRIPKIDCINIHNSPLPKYRGMLPSFWQLYHGEKSAGITIHKIDKGIDTGEIIRQDFVDINDNDTLNDLVIKTKKMDARILIEIIEDYHKGKIQYKKMEGKGSYYSFPTSQDVNEFKKKGKKLL
jgi:methionyl-tRNA formyltransferase